MRYRCAREALKRAILGEGSSSIIVGAMTVGAMTSCFGGGEAGALSLRLLLVLFDTGVDLHLKVGSPA